MWPTFRPGDRIVLETCDARALRPGDVVVFRGGARGCADADAEVTTSSTSSPSSPDARLVCHRVLRVDVAADRVTVHSQGDCTRAPDPPWSADRLVGRVVAVDPVRGRRRSIGASPFLGWRLRHRLSVRRALRALGRRLPLVGGLMSKLANV
jgi:hypothetical protein